jgi:hypothetical protein
MRNEPALKKSLEPLLDDAKEPVRLRAAAGYLRLSAIQAKARIRKSPAPPVPPAEAPKKQ